MRFRLLLTLVAAAHAACPAAMAQETQRYVHFPFDPNANTLVQDRLNQLKNTKQLQDLIDRFRADPKRFGFDTKTPEKLAEFKKAVAGLAKLNLDDPDVQGHLKPLADMSAQGKLRDSPDKLGKLMEEAIARAIADKKTSASAEHAGSPTTQPKPLTPEPVDAKTLPPMPEDPDAEAKMRDWLTGVMERAEESNVGEWLRESPAFQKALQDLHGSVRMPDVQPNGWGLDRLLKLDKLPMPDATALERLERFKPNLPHIDPPALPSLRRPSLPPVSAPSAPSMASLGTLATWLLCLALVALFVWQASRWINLTGGSARDRAADLGPWPVQPDAISTRTDLVKAFDYLALLLLGVKARTWHHRAIGQALGERAAAHPDAAQQLAALYEQARYTEGAETLAADDRDRARAALAQLAGVAA